MAKHWVICKHCGKQFDVSRSGGYRYNETGRYVCKSCYRKLKKMDNMANKEASAAKRGMKQTYLAMLIKIIVGIMILCAAPAAKGGNVAILAIMGLAVIAWAIVPFVRRRK